jgi:hypothetical protein
MKRIFFIFLFAATFVARAHVGSPNIFFDGNAGAYPVHIIIRPPNVVPGLAEIVVRVDGEGVKHVSALPVFWDTGRKGAPPPDEARIVRGETNVYAATLWLMKSGGYSVDVNIEGARGGGTVIVPVNAVATNTRGMSTQYSLMLMALAVLLVAGAVRIAGAIFGESLLAPGEMADLARIRRGRLAMVITALVVSVALFGGKYWWNVTEKEYRQKVLYKASGLSAKVVERPDQNIMELQIDDAGGREQGPELMPDHGKLMHLFLIREPDLNVFAHLHPLKRSWQKFEVALPPLPAGRYQLYADITHETGFAETLIAETDVPVSSQRILRYWSDGSTDQICGSGVIRNAPPEGFPLPPDVDDAWHVDGRNRGGQSGGVARVSDGCAMTWLSAGELIENRETSLHFQLIDTNGAPIVLEPYIGMYGHAVVRRNDGAVFVHIHPEGTFSMAAQEYFAKEVATKTPQNQVGTTKLDPVRDVSFPYAFPSPGAYHVWVQLKSGGKIYTGVFEAVVKPAKVT